MSSLSKYVQILVVIVGLLATLGSGILSLQRAEQKGADLFDKAVVANQEGIADRLRSVRHALDAVASVFAASTEVSSKEFTAFVDDFPLKLLGEQSVRPSIIAFGWLAEPENKSDPSFIKFLSNDARRLDLAGDPVQVYRTLAARFETEGQYAVTDSLPILGLYMDSPSRMALLRPVNYPWYLRAGDSADLPRQRGLLFAILDLKGIFSLSAPGETAALVVRATSGSGPSQSLLVENQVSRPESGLFRTSGYAKSIEIPFGNRQFHVDFVSGAEARMLSFGLLDLLVPLGLILLTLLLLSYLRSLEAQNREMRRAREAAEQAVSVKSAFMATMSHEIRTPMNGILGMAQLLLRSELNQRQKKFTSDLLSSAEALMSIINDILDFSKIESGHMELDPVPLDLAELVNDLGQLYSPVAQAQGVELILDLPLEVPRGVVADPGRLRQVLSNLLSNALKFTEQGHVRLEIREVAHAADSGTTGLRFRVEDSGIGIPAAALEHIFERFSQADGSTTRRFGGTGLGLSICKELLALMGGEIWVDSQPAVGSVFTFQLTLPRSPEAAGSRKPERSLADCRALLVEDHPIARLVLARQIKGLGMDCDSAQNGGEALALAAKACAAGAPYSILFIDASLPDMSGDRLARELKASPETASSALLRMAASAEDIDEGDGQLFSATVGKPIVIDYLAAVARQVLDGGQAGGLAPASPEAQAATLGRDPALVQGSPLPFLGRRVLLVEDNEVNQVFAEALLMGFGCQVRLAEHGQEALEALSEEVFDLVLMDCQMPVMDGFEATRRIKARILGGELTELPVIALTANALAGDRDACLRAGMDDYLSKPIHEEVLLAMLRKWFKSDSVETPSESPEETPAEALAEQPRPAQLAHPLVDQAVIEETRSLLQARFDAVLAGYFDDTEGYLGEIDRGLQGGQPTDLVRPAHTIKSSSQVMGALALAELAAELEQAAKALVDQGGASSDLRAPAAELREVFGQTQAALQKFMQAA